MNTVAMTALRERISAAAQELFLREGLEGFSMRKVAEMAGISAPAIYRHYENKDDLLNEVITGGLEILEDYLEPALQAASPYERLSALTDRFLDFALEQPKYFEFAFMVPSRSIGHFPEELTKRNWSTFQLAVEQVAQCMEQGIFKKDEPIETAILLWSTAHGLIMLYRTQRFGPNPELFRTIYRRALDRLREGLKP